MYYHAPEILNNVCDKIQLPPKNYFIYPLNIHCIYTEVNLHNSQVYRQPQQTQT